MTVPEDMTASDSLRANLWTVGALGMNVWIVINVWPVTFSVNTQAWEIYLLPLSPTLLLLATRGMPDRTTVARWILLTFFPISLLIPVLLRSEIDNQRIFTPLVLLFSALSLAAYIIFTLDALASHVRNRQTDYKPLAVPDASTSQPVRIWLRRFVIAFSLLGAACIAAVGPSFGGFRNLERDWGNASIQAGLLITLVSSTLAVAVLLSFLGPVLKTADRRQRTSREQKRKLISALVLSLFGFLTFYLLQTQ